MRFIPVKVALFFYGNSKTVILRPASRQQLQLIPSNILYIRRLITHLILRETIGIVYLAGPQRVKSRKLLQYIYGILRNGIFNPAKHTIFSTTTAKLGKPIQSANDYILRNIS